MITETIATWNKETNQVQWIDYQVKPNPYDEENRWRKKSANELYDAWFPQDSPFRVRPAEANDL